ncbi:hypothetical protein IC006_0105 [Sulfuracidifex tepidarius]|uniref:Glycosyltransferase 2-like domain-containing protein n=1 Tax=Sulfuracidifex tepidarius TaxID=1294262 RepID=A0A510DRL6_9CREN|nr:hypothetical protein [Sulfuracidifex tepidarius]BBG22821.1 hypothetical protein IC006_0105 [Sulfuracidifex tepidarius]
MSSLSLGVLVTVYKRYDFIKDALSSLKSQDVLPDKVVIMADDKSKVPKIDGLNVEIIENIRKKN